ncbi:hypothetical protein JCGZ_12619 [Jatropha curcas]|uniref:Myb-like domain-containing protein n=1 Tax=Jatropha curcas TaxID=180498 RepID=A0A067KAW7_JATCU|nr:hypothetical protein JCGZ_12619 [Jatropha curcas]
MRKRRNSKRPSTSNSTSTSTSTTALYELTTPLRRSQRLLNRKTPNPNTENPKLKTNCIKSDRKSIISGTPAQGSRRTPRLSNKVDSVSSLRRSSRLSLLGNTISATIKKTDREESKKKPIGRLFNKSADKVEIVSSLRRSSRLSLLGNTNSAIIDKSDPEELKKKPVSCLLNKSADKKRGAFNTVNGKVGLRLCGDVLQRSETNLGCVNIELVIGLKAPERRNGFEISKATRVTGKRKREEERVDGSVKGWTKEQEMALQRAYFVAKPTPNFWKKVSKLVPGKSAQDCFDKVNSDHITPPQPLPRSRAKRLNSSPLGCFSLSTGKLLGSSDSKGKRLGCNKQKSHLAHKAVRQLLQKHNRMDQNYEADIFSILEPNMNPSRQISHLNDVISTPNHLQEKQGFLRKCHERSNSGQEKPFSRFRSSCGPDIVSPPVLKQVKNRALHEKYIDQLHSREAKRKAACVRAGKENMRQSNIQKIDMVRAAKNALVSDARDAIDKLKHLQTVANNNSSDSDDEVDSDDECDVF